VKVLIADDTEVNRLVLSAILRGAGLEVLQAVDGQQALDLAREHRPDLVLLDVMMPRLDGWQVMAAMKADPALADLPVVFLTSKGETADKIRGLELGAADYVTKPFDAGEVLARVRTQVRLRQLTRSLAEANAELRTRQKLIDEDLRAAADIQRALLPRGPLELPGLQATSFFLPSHHVGGDIFSLQRLDADHAVIWVLDVSGHGVGAAMVTVSVAQRLSPQGGIVAGDPLALKPTAAEPKEVLARLDGEYPVERFDRFFTITYLLLELRTGRVRYSSAGHPPPILQRRDGTLSSLEEGGTLIGLGTGSFDQGEVWLRPGDRLALYTDGLVDYQGKAETAFGADRLREVLSSTRGLKLAEAGDALVQGVLGHGAAAPPDDDLTVLLVEWTGPEAPTLSLGLYSTLQHVRAGADWLRQFLLKEGVSSADQDALELCFVEAANNAVLHAYNGEPNHRVDLDCRVLHDRIVLTVRDQGTPIPPHALDARVQAEGTPVWEIAESGRGGLLLHSLADEVELKTGPDGNALILTRLRTTS